MGMRGIGAALREMVASEVTGRVLPWEDEKLSRVEKVIAFLEFLPITKGKLEGQNLKLLPVQRRFIERVYGAKGKVQIGVLSMPRGNGKTGLIAGLCLCHLLGPEAEFRGACYSAAIDRKQAAIISDEMEAIIMKVPEFAAVANIKTWPTKVIEVKRGPAVGSVYEPLSADGRRGHGLSPTFWVYDELAQAKGRELLDSLKTSMGKRKQTLGMVISTQAATDEAPLSQLIDLGLRGINKAIVVELLAAPVDANPFDRKVISSVNPAFGKFLDAETVFAEAREAREIPAFQSAFRNLRLNQRVAVDGEDAFIPQAVWNRSSKPIDRSLFTDGRPVYGGLDLSQRLDLTALVLACEDDEGNSHLWPFAWTPKDTIRERAIAENCDFMNDWVRDGYLLTTPGVSVDYDWLAAAIAETVAPMNLISIQYDPYQKKELFAAFARVGFSPPMKEFPQNIRTFGPPMADFRVKAAEGRFRHGGHPVLKWCVLNTKTVRDHANNHKPDKRREFGRIDLAVAAVMAMAERMPVFVSGAMIG